MAKPSELRELNILERFVQNGLSDTAIMAWGHAVTGHRFMAYEKKVLVVYSIVDGKPVIYRKLRCTGVQLSAEHGIESMWADDDHGRSIVLAHTPTEVAPGVFVGHTIYSSVEYTEHKAETYGARFSMYFRSQKHPLYTRTPNVYYILEQTIFDDEFPGY